MTPKRPSVLTRTALALALGLAGAGASAQSLQALYDAARGYDATYLGAQASAQAAQARADQANALLLPTVGLQASSTLNRAESSSHTVGTGLDQSVSSEVHTRSDVVGLSASQTLFNGANSATIRQAERGLKVAEAQLRAAEQDLIIRVAQAYFDVLGAQDALFTVQANKKANAEQLASAKRNFEVGTATITDTREAQARYDLVLAQEVAADNDLRVKKLALEQLVGRPGLTPRPLATPVALPTLAPASVDEWVNRAEAENTAVTQARLAQEVARLETDKARAGHLPTVVLGATYGRSYPAGSTDTTTNGFPTTTRLGNGHSATLGVTVTVPLFAGFAVQNRVRETLSLEDKARNDLEAARRSVTQGTRSAFFGVQAGQAQVRALEAAESSSRLALEATQLGYKVGVRVNLDVLNAQAQLFQTQRDLAKARYDVIVGGLKLRQVAGSLAPEDVGNVNALLSN